MTDPHRPSLLSAILARRWIVVRNTLLVGALVAGLSLLLPNKYTASSQLLPPDQQSDLSSLLSGVPGALALSRLVGMDVGSGTNLYIGVMRSGHVTGRIIERFHLVQAYKAKDAEKAAKALATNTDLALTNEGMVRVAVTDKDRTRAANIANAYVEELDRFLRENGNATARHRRAFLEQRVAEARAELDVTEDSLRDYQVAHRMPAVGADASRAASALGDLMGQRAALEVELGTLETVERTPSPRETELRTRIGQIDAQLTRIPPATTAMGRLYRSAKMQEAVLLVLTEEFEKAKLLELKNTPSVEVLDRAAPPIHKSGPHRTLIVLAGVVLALAANVLVVGARATRAAA